MSAEPLTRDERDKLQDPRRWGLIHQRWEATVRAETSRADVAEAEASWLHAELDRAYGYGYEMEWERDAALDAAYRAKGEP